MKSSSLKNRILSILLMAIMTLGTLGFFASEEVRAATKSVESYSYTITPIVSPFNVYYYVKTDNPDPTSFRFVDKTSKYFTKYNGYNGIINVVSRIYADVTYEKTSTFRVKGGYIFRNVTEDSDGGSLMLQKKNANGSFSDTSVKVNCAAVKDRYDYLLDTYTKKSMSFMDKMDALFKGILQIAVYPKRIYKQGAKSEAYPYPYISTSKDYEGLGLMDNYEIYKETKYALLSELNLYSYDTQMLSDALLVLADRLGVNYDYTRDEGATWKLSITYNGETKTYVGEGAGGYDPLFSDSIPKLFKFSGASSDLATGATIKKLRDKYVSISADCAKVLDNQRSQLTGEIFKNRIGGGSWIMTASGVPKYNLENTVEGTKKFDEAHGGSAFAYVSNTYKGNPLAMMDAWVDGRYVGKHYTYEAGAKFSDHPKASIILRNQTYVDSKGDEHTQDLVYKYDSATDTWRATFYYFIEGKYNYKTDVLPDQFILTRKQVNAIKPDKNTNTVPSSGYIYDGTKAPGTSFKHVAVTGVSVTKSITIREGEEASIDVQVKPSNATVKDFTITSSDITIANISNNGKVYGNSAGKAVVTVKTFDGGYTAKCTVTVVPEIESIKIKGNYENNAVKIKVGETLSLGVEIKPKTADLNKVVWTSDDTKVAKVDSSGKVTGLSEGMALIRATAGDKFAYLTVRVSKSGGSVTPTPEPGTTKIRRIYGDDRYMTAMAIADAYKQDSNQSKFNALVIARGDNYPDALAGAYLAKSLNAPILIWREKAHSDISTYIKKNVKTGSTIYILGGTAVVSDDVKKGLSGYRFKRLAGADRFETNTKILEQAKFKKGEILVCDALTYQNALISSATGKPILLVTGNGLRAPQKAFLSKLSKKDIQITIIGNTKSVSSGIETELKAYASKVTRITGSNPDQISAKVAAAYFSKPKEVMLAVDNAFPDGLCGSILAIQNKAPLCLVSESSYSKTKAYANKFTLDRVTVFGGGSLVTDKVAKSIANIK